MTSEDGSCGGSHGMCVCVGMYSYLDTTFGFDFTDPHHSLHPFIPIAHRAKAFGNGVCSRLMGRNWGETAEEGGGEGEDLDCRQINEKLNK